LVDRAARLLVLCGGPTGNGGLRPRHSRVRFGAL
jgi:hypothetical protein